jgi:hypothetical protein
MTVLTLTTPRIFPNTDFAPIVHIYADRVEEREVLHGIIEKYKDRYATMRPDSPDYDRAASNGAKLLMEHWNELQQADRKSTAFRGNLELAAKGRGLKYRVLPKLMMTRYFGSEFLEKDFDSEEKTSSLRSELEKLPLSEEELAKYTFRLLSYMTAKPDEQGRVWFEFNPNALAKLEDVIAFHNDAAKFSVLLEWYLKRGIYRLPSEMLMNSHLETVRRADDIAKRFITDLDGTLRDANVVERDMRNPTIQYLVYSRILNAEWVATQLAFLSSESDRARILSNVRRYSPFIAAQADALRRDETWLRRQYYTTGILEILDKRLQETVPKWHSPFYFAFAAVSKDAQVNAAFTPIDRVLGAYSSRLAYQWVPQPKWLIACLEATDLFPAIPMVSRHLHGAIAPATAAYVIFTKMQEANKEQAAELAARGMIGPAEHGSTYGSRFAALLSSSAKRSDEFINVMRELIFGKKSP